MGDVAAIRPEVPNKHDFGKKSMDSRLGGQTACVELCPRDPCCGTVELLVDLGLYEQLIV